MKKNIFITLVITAGLVLAGCLPFQTKISDSQATQENINADQADSSSQIKELSFTATESGSTAYELLSANAEVETTDYGQAGVFINSINGLAGNEKNYWAFYVNGQYSNVGVSQTILEPGDEVTFKYEAIDNADFE